MQLVKNDKVILIGDARECFGALKGVVIDVMADTGNKVRGRVCFVLCEGIDKPICIYENDTIMSGNVIGW